MERISVTPDVLDQLRNTGYPAEILDDAGARVAVVVPPDVFHEMFDAYCTHVLGHPLPPVTAADIAAAVTTEELIAHGRDLEAKNRGAA